MSIKNSHILIDNLSFSYSNQNILDKISFEIEKGEFCSIIGPNGSGKTTLLKNISKSITPKKDTIFIENEDVIKINRKDIARKMALVPQNTYIDFEFSVLDVVLMGRTPYLNRFEGEKKEDFNIAKEAMIKTNVWNLKDKSISKISGGEMQRVLIARALTQETSILLLDEPVSHLDMNHQIELMDTLKLLNEKENKTIVVVLHDLNIAVQYSNKVILLNNGMIEAIGHPKEVLTKEIITKIYNIDVHILENPVTGKPYIIPISKTMNNDNNNNNNNKCTMHNAQCTIKEEIF
ncbi:ABC transporter ATP-binding protein [Clostridium sp. DL1XJH146]